MAGAVSTKQTDLAVTGATVGNFSRSFSQDFTSTALGALATQRYPKCIGSPCPPDAPDRTVVNGYTNGMLTSVGPYYATGVSYHPNGMIKQVTHAKRVFDVAAGFAEKGDRDANAMARPAKIYTTGVTLPGTGAAANWDAGSYAFDFGYLIANNTHRIVILEEMARSLVAPEIEQPSSGRR